jgi:hypothetical protein
VSAGRTAGGVSNVAFAVGAAGLGAAALIYLLDRHKSPPASALSPGQGALRAAW